MLNIIISDKSKDGNMMPSIYIARRSMLGGGGGAAGQVQQTPDSTVRDSCWSPVESQFPLDVSHL